MTEPKTPLRELAFLFLKLGTTAFGGPAAHIAMMEEEVVRRRGWLTHAEFLDYLGATNLIPGPNSTEMAIHVGWARAGFRGLLVAGLSFILPAALIVTVIAWAYVRYGTLPAAGALLYGVKPVVIAVVLQALWRLGRTAVKSWPLALLGAVAITATFLRVNEMIVLAGGGILAAGAPRSRATALALPLPLGLGAVLPATLGGIFLAFAKIGAVLFGSGYVLLAFLRADFVEHLHWITSRQLLDAVAVGQITPGPVFTTATFVGYLIHGASGAATATAGIFAPAFFYVAVSGPLVPWLRRSATAGRVLDGVNVASLALMAVVTWQLSRDALVDWRTSLMALIAAALLFRTRVNSAWLVLGGAAVGLLFSAGA
ncbi:MAG TPA: chromate efflux transporter [Gemmatimonadales bacterium]|nr:chromate efflux transporter [Gemmatimonadales bacterium]